jgi:hypothetical protein
MEDQFLNRTESFKMDGHTDRIQRRFEGSEEICVHAFKANHSFQASTIDMNHDFLAIQTEDTANCLGENVAVEFTGSGKFQKMYIEGHIMNVMHSHGATKILVKITKSSRRFKEALSNALAS